MLRFHRRVVDIFQQNSSGYEAHPTERSHNQRMYNGQKLGTPDSLRENLVQHIHSQKPNHILDRPRRQGSQIHLSLREQGK